MAEKKWKIPGYKVGLAIAFLNLFLAAIGGALLRLAFVIELPFIDFKNVLHAHSHTAMLGWATIALFALLEKVNPGLSGKGLRTAPLYIGMEICILVMAAGFVAGGYGPWAIGASSCFLLLSYGYIFWWFRTWRKAGTVGPSGRLAKTALLFFILSTLFLWALGPVIGLGYRFSTGFHLLVQAFLHFHINGWLILAVLAIFFKALEQTGFQLNPKVFQRFFLLFILSVFLTYALAIAWSDPEWWFFLLNSVGVCVQLLAIVYLWLVVRPGLSNLRKHFSSLGWSLTAIAMLALTLKVIIQACVVIPFLAEIAYTIRYYVIGFLHLILLGYISVSILAFLIEEKPGGLLPKGLLNAGVGLFLGGVLTTELLLFTQGTMAWGTLGMIPGYYLVLFLATCLLPLGAGTLAILWMRHIVHGSRQIPER